MVFAVCVTVVVAVAVALAVAVGGAVGGAVVAAAAAGVVVVVPRRTPWRLVVSGVFSLRSSRHSRSRASSIAFVGAGH